MCRDGGKKLLQIIILTLFLNPAFMHVWSEPFNHVVLCMLSIFKMFEIKFICLIKKGD